MASIKAIAAIALTLMVAVPILMGFAFSSTSTTTEEWETTSTTNATDLLLNSSRPYFTDYVGAQNNMTIMQKQVYPGPGVTEWHQVAPSYITVGDTATTIPTYSSSSSTVSISNTVTNTYTLSGGGSTVSIGNANSGATTLVSDYAMSTVSISTSDAGYHWIIELDGGSTLSQYDVSGLTIYKVNNSLTVVVDYNIADSETYTGVTTWKITTDADGTITYKHAQYRTLSINYDYSFTISGALVSLVPASGSNTDLLLDSTTTVTKTKSGTVYVNSDVYTGISSISVAKVGGTTLSYTYMHVDGHYADPADGWNLPTVSGAATYDWWYNGQLNDEVRIMVDFSKAAVLYLAAVDDFTDSFTVELSYNGTNLSVIDLATNTTTVLGSYSSAMVVMDCEKATVYGIAEWPTIGVYPTTYNEVTVDYTDLSAPFPYVRMQAVNGDATGTSYVALRADHSSIQAGTFPSTENFTLDLSEKYPAQSLTFTIKSIAFYGDTIAFGGTSYTVTDGKITGTDTDGESFTVPLRGVVVRYAYDNGSYTVDINGHEIAGTASTVYFGGEWSITSSISLISQTYPTQQVWVPGEFAFDKQDFAACGLMVAGACLVGLGMTGARSGIKMGVLLLICGGGALIYLTMI